MKEASPTSEDDPANPNLRTLDPDLFPWFFQDDDETWKSGYPVLVRDLDESPAPTCA